MLEISSIKTPTDFMKAIEELAALKKIEYIDAVLLYCSETGLEVETAGQLIKQCGKIKAKIQLEAEEMNYLPKSAKLPI